MSKLEYHSPEAFMRHVDELHAPHYHKDKQGLAHACYHKCKEQVTSWKFWCGLTIVNWIEFLPEHIFWFRVPVFKSIAHWLGLS